MAFIICFEGVDGSGKTTQLEMLYNELLKRDMKVNKRSYPVYDSFFGRELGKLLSGTEHQFKASTLDPKSMALWYASDRWLDYKENIQLFENDGFLLLNRYTLSSKVYQSLRDNNPDMVKWVDELEHEILELPRPNLYIVLDIHPEISRANVFSKSQRSYIGEGEADIYEGDIVLQQKARRLYLELAKETKTIKVVSCYDEDKMLDPQKIHEKILSLLVITGLLK